MICEFCDAPIRPHGTRVARWRYVQCWRGHIYKSFAPAVVAYVPPVGAGPVDDGGME